MAGGEGEGGQGRESRQRASLPRPPVSPLVDDDGGCACISKKKNKQLIILLPGHRDRAKGQERQTAPRRQLIAGWGGDKRGGNALGVRKDGRNSVRRRGAGHLKSPTEGASAR